MISRSVVFRIALLALVGYLFIACSPGENKDDLGSWADGGADGSADNGGDTETGSDGGASDAGGDTGPGYDVDGDGFTKQQGDCDDQEEFVNPNAIEDLGVDGGGDEVDNDCDGETDELESCDCPELGDLPAELVMAMELCDTRFGLGVQRKSSSPGGVVAFATVSAMGNNDCLYAHQGCEMTALSTGPVGQPNPNSAIGMGLSGTLLNDPKPDFQGDIPSTGVKQLSCDVSQLAIDMRAPSNALGFSFDFLFGSAEYDEWILQNYNDTFYAILEYSALNGGATTNIAFDDNGSEIEVDANYFENALHLCDESGSGWEPEITSKSGSTGWLRTTWNVAPGDEFKLTFSIHDEGDCVFDSIVFIDNFRWHTEAVEPGTEPVVR